ncbi:hypothetical protein [Schlesneria sp. T3-172]|uniref:hypothetical protein n=1 Tax=Schlesneria sphaerica TaxID=3373610 RepID=UPI0037CC45B2
MLVAPLKDLDQEMPDPKGHTIGFLSSEDVCDVVVEELIMAGISGSGILVLSGPTGTELFTRMMKGSLWGEAVEKMLKDGVLALEHGDVILVVAVEDREQALLVAKVAEEHGGRGFNYFGEWTDERLTR